MPAAVVAPRESIWHLEISAKMETSPIWWGLGRIAWRQRNRVESLYIMSNTFASRLRHEGDNSTTNDVSLIFQGIKWEDMPKSVISLQKCWEPEERRATVYLQGSIILPILRRKTFSEIYLNLYRSTVKIKGGVRGWNSLDILQIVKCLIGSLVSFVSRVSRSGESWYRINSPSQSDTVRMSNLFGSASSGNFSFYRLCLRAAAEAYGCIGSDW